MILIEFKLANYSDDKNNTVFLNPFQVTAVTTNDKGETCICVAGDTDNYYRVDGSVYAVAERLRAAWGDAGCAI